MYLSIFENKEFFANRITNKVMEFNSNCGTIFVDFLNDYRNIKYWLFKRKKYIINNHDSDFCKEYYKIADENHGNLDYIYRIIFSEYRQKIKQFESVKKNIEDVTSFINNELLPVVQEKSVIDSSKNLIVQCEKLLKYSSSKEEIEQNEKDIIDNFIRVLNFCYVFVNSYNKYAEPLILKKIVIPKSYVFTGIQEENKVSICKETKGKIKTISIYCIEDLQEFTSIYLKLIIDKRLIIKKCKNCGKYFIPNNKQVYCDNPSPQNPNKTCRLLTDDMRNNKNPIYEVYRNNYKTQSNKKRRNKHILDIEDKFSIWNIKAKEKMQECQQGKITLDEYKIWLKNSQNWIKGEIK